MNHIYKVVFCKATNTFVAVAEFARAHGKKGSTKVGQTTKSTTGKRLALSSLAAAMAMSSIPAMALVEGDDSGISAIAIGDTSVASGTFSLATGYGATASAANSIASGVGAESSANNATAIGTGAVASGVDSIAFGSEAESTGLYAIAIGDRASADTYSISIGQEATATGESVAIGGSQTVATGTQSVAIGVGANSTGDLGTAIGTSADATGDGGTAIGNGSDATGDQSTAIGISSYAEADNSVALGAGSTAYRAEGVVEGATATSDAAYADNQVYALETALADDIAAIEATTETTLGAVSVGRETEDGTSIETRQITNVAAGSEDTDAVNVSQLKAVANVVEQGINITADVFSGDESEAGVQDNVAMGETIAYTSEDGTVVTTVGDNEIDLSVNTDGTTIVTNDDGTISALTSSVVSGDNVAVAEDTNEAGGTEYTVSAEDTTVTAGSDYLTVTETLTESTDDDAGVDDYAVDLSDATKEILEDADAGFNIAADNGTEDNVQLTETVTYTSSDESITTTVADNEIDFVVDTSNVDITYSANDGSDLTVSLADGFDFSRF